MNEQQTSNLAQAWIATWNRHELDAIVHYSAPEVEFISPFVPRLYGEPSGTIIDANR